MYIYVSKVYNLDLTQIGYEYYIKFLDIEQVIKTCCSKTSQIVPFPHSGELSHGENHMWRRQSKFWHLVHRRHILTHSDQNLIWHWKLVRASGIFAAHWCAQRFCTFKAVKPPVFGQSSQHLLVNIERSARLRLSIPDWNDQRSNIITVLGHSKCHPAGFSHHQAQPQFTPNNHSGADASGLV